MSYQQLRLVEISRAVLMLSMFLTLDSASNIHSSPNLNAGCMLTCGEYVMRVISLAAVYSIYLDF